MNSMFSSETALRQKERREKLLEFRGVSKAFGAYTAVRDVNLSVAEGEFITLVGPSGCGKSTLLNMVAGLFPATQGSVTYRGQEVSGINSRVGYMTQADHLLPWRTVEGNIRIPLEIAGLSRAEINAKVSELVALVGLKGFEKNYPNQLSGGMKKRTALARLLAYDPETLLFDEPFAALDAQLRLKMQMELRRIAGQLKKTILFVTHDLDEAVALADRCVVFEGRPGTIREIVDIPLPSDRNLFKLRHVPEYVALTAKLWDEMNAAELAATN